MEKIFTVVETTQDYKDVYTTVWGASKNKETAKKILKDAVLELNEYEEERYEEGLQDNGDWVRNDDDIYQTIAIYETELDD